MCQTVLRSIADIQFRNEVERDEIEDEYERLLQDLAAAEQEVVAAEGKLLTLNDIGSQLEMRSNQLHEKVESLQNTKDAQDSERNDINSKVSTGQVIYCVLITSSQLLLSPLLISSS
jgi:predicted nuclease with TOPRIM domain